jgi:hypothetical protein
MTDKPSELKEAINHIFFGSQDAINNDKCPICNEDIKEFRDSISKEEYELSGMCQDCQDLVFSDREDV